MKFAIEGFSQAKLIEYGLDMRDALFLRWFADFQQTEQMLVLVDGDITFYWLKYSYIIEQIPIIDLKTEGGVRHYLLRLIDSGVLHKKTNANGKGRGARAYYNIDPGVWRALTEKHDHRTTQDGEHDHRIGEDGKGPDQRIGEDGETNDHRTAQDGHILLSSDSSSRGRDSGEAAQDKPPPPLENGEKEPGIDPIVRLQVLMRKSAPALSISDPVTIEYIRHFVRRRGTDALEAVAREYIREKTARKIVQYFDKDFKERLADADKRATYSDTTTLYCSKCRRRSAIIVDWDGEKVCPACAAGLRAENQAEAVDDRENTHDTNNYGD